MINVGFIGCGRISDVHSPGYKNNKDARIYAVCDSNPETVRIREKQWKAEKAYTDYRELLADPKIDAVEILTPHSLHEQMVIDAAAAGKHIALQKPMTNSLESADRMVDAARKAGVVFKVSDNYVWYPPTLHAKKIIENGEIGTPMNLKIKLITGGSGGWAIPPSSWEWRLKDFEMGFPEECFDHGHHLWSTAWFLFGPMERVVAWVDSADGIVDTPSVVMWKHTEGMRYGMCEVACANQMHIPSKYYANDEWMEITGTRGIIVINRCNGNINCGPPVSLFNGKKWIHYPSVKSDWVEGFIGGTRNFIAAVQGKENPRLSGEEGRDVLRFSLALLKSNKIRREVYVDEMDARFPGILYRRRVAKEKKARGGSKSLLERLGIGGSGARLAPKARELTEALAARFNPEAVKGWECLIGLHLLAEGGTQESKYSIEVKKGRMQMTEGNLPENAVFTLKIGSGTWAAILMKKKRLETAFITGKLKIEGRAEEALKLRAAVGL